MSMSCFHSQPYKFNIKNYVHVWLRWTLKGLPLVLSCQTAYQPVAVFGKHQLWARPSARCHGYKHARDPVLYFVKEFQPGVAGGSALINQCRGRCHARCQHGVLVEQSGRVPKAQGQDKCQEEHPGRGNAQEESGRKSRVGQKRRLVSSGRKNSNEGTELKHVIVFMESRCLLC